MAAWGYHSEGRRRPRPRSDIGGGMLTGDGAVPLRYRGVSGGPKPHGRARSMVLELAQRFLFEKTEERVRGRDF